jgi:hypothetical protein
MSAFLTIAAVIVVLWLLTRSRLRPPLPAAQRPSTVGRDRLASELAKLQTELEGLQQGDTGRVVKVRRKLQTAWVEEQLARVPIECVKVDGVGARLVEALRAAGICSLADLDRVNTLEVPGVGEARAEALEKVYDETWRKASADYGRLTDAALDRWSNGQLAAARLHDEQVGVTRARRTAALAARMADLRQRAEAAGYTDIDEALHERSSQQAPAAYAPSTARLTPAQASERGASNCPRCGATLRRVTGRYGDFLGCTRYPTCRYTRSC